MTFLSLSLFPPVIYLFFASHFDFLFLLRDRLIYMHTMDDAYRMSL